jgi:hypothetical protein
MPKVAYVTKRFGRESLAVIQQAETIIDEYIKQGFKLTLRQLYYQFVSRDLLANTVRNYKRLGSIINDGRLAGLIDWDAIEDRTRSVNSPSHWGTPGQIVDSAAYSYRVDKWLGQPHRAEVWVEKEALAGVFERICGRLDISFLCCRGYTSQSEMWGSAVRLATIAKSQKQVPIILHFGDHDPSGIDMTRDIHDRLDLFTGGLIKIKRIALNMNQVDEYTPPPNPAKVTDSRFASYEREYGNESWELDALNPTVLETLVRDEVTALIDLKKWDARTSYEAEGREQLQKVAGQWDTVVERLDDNE